MPKAAAELEQLRARYETYVRQKAEAEGALRQAQSQLDDLRQQARAQYGTDDLSLLRQKLTEMRQANQRRLEEYRRHLDEIARRLESVEKADQEARP